MVALKIVSVQHIPLYRTAYFMPKVNVLFHLVQECKGRPVSNANILPAPHQKVPVSPRRHPVGQEVGGTGAGRQEVRDFETPVLMLVAKTCAIKPHWWRYTAVARDAFVSLGTSWSTL